MEGVGIQITHKAEHAVDIDSGAPVAVILQGADLGDTMHEALAGNGMPAAELLVKKLTGVMTTQRSYRDKMK